MLTCDEYLTPTSLDEAFAAMAAHRGRHRLIAGGTDILPWAREGRAGDVDVPVLIDITRISELTERKVAAGRVRVGAATPIQRFLDDKAIATAMPCMPRCAIWFADDQIREQATIGGNLANASPAADGVPPLLAHAAGVELASKRDGRLMRRLLPLNKFILGSGKTALADDEIMIAIECDALPGYGGSFEKVGHRRSLVISVVCLAGLVKLDASRRRFEDVRLALGGVCPVPQRLTEVENFLRGAAIDSGRLERAAAMPLDFVQSRTRREYRREVVHGFVMRGLINALRRAGADADVLKPELEAAYA
ncbi:FAD binding domain-containing protein [Xanthobacteraceae bacterium Astr-EGSB]|uniref:FAD binding domain-containing protein n=1 Tax=Astrobacterium formosum TaxID=3069710 RepID=UPI0027B4901C|nr:FAD binding domain-containing protein [Xanthobacteraceae bacterium Astr-EGSB]